MQVFTGKWWSEKYTSVFSRGNVYVKMYAEEKSHPYRAQAEIQYLGVYRLRQKQKFNILISSQGDSTAPYSVPEVKVGQRTAPSGEGELKFTVTKRQGDVIEGKYTFTNPEDHGSFRIEKGEGHGEQCCIM